MKLVLNLFLFLIALVIYGAKSLSLTDYQIRRICKEEIRESTCIKNLKKKRSDLKEGKLIEIPVLPYRK